MIDTIERKTTKCADEHNQPFISIKCAAQKQTVHAEHTHTRTYACTQVTDTLSVQRDEDTLLRAALSAHNDSNNTRCRNSHSGTSSSNYHNCNAATATAATFRTSGDVQRKAVLSGVAAGRVFDVRGRLASA